MGTWKFHNVTDNVDFWPVLDSINITSSQPCGLATFTGVVAVDDLLADEDEVTASYADDDTTFVKQFAGFISVQTDAHVEPIAEPAMYPFSARDYTTLLDDTIILADRNVTESIKDRVLWIMSQGNSFGVTAGSGIEDIAQTIGPGLYKLKSRREALDDVAAVASAVFYIDFDKDLLFYYYTSAVSAPFDLVTPATPTTSYPYRAFTLDKDATDQADAVVSGNSDGTYVIRTRGGAPAANLRKQRVIITEATTVADLEAAGDAELARIGLAQQSGSLVCWQPGLFSGMTVHITNPTHSIDDDFVISSVGIRPMDLNPENIGDPGGHAEWTIGFADRLLCIPQRDNSKPAITPPVDCTDCTKAVAILPAGMDENFSLAEGLSHMFVYDAPALVAYNCAVQLTAGPTNTSGADLTTIDHEPNHEALFAGDRAFYVGTVGPFGDNRWSNGSDQVTAGRVMDIRRAWVAVTGSVSAISDTFTRANTTSPALGTNDTGQTYAAALGGADSSGSVSGGSTIGVVSNKLKFVGGTDAEKTIRGSGFSYDMGSPSNLYVQGMKFTYGSNALRTTTFGMGMNTETIFCSVLQRASDGKFALSMESDTDGAIGTYQTLTSGTDYDLRWERFPAASGGYSRARIWASAGSEPTSWDLTIASGDESSIVNSGGDGFSLYFSGAYTVEIDSYYLSGGDELQSIDMTDGSLIASTPLTPIVYDVRATPNGQHLFALLGNSNDGPFQRFSRDLTTEAIVPITDFYVDLQDFNVDDAYNVYAIKANVLTRYNAAGTSVWSVDLNAVYGYRWPSRVVFGSAYGSGQTIIADSAKGTVKVCGYIGGATWTSGGSYGVVLTLARSDGSLISQSNQVTTGGNAAAQTIAMCLMGPCLWLAGAADGTDFESNAISGVNGWLMKVPY